MRYYFVIDPIEDLETGFLGLSIKPREVTQQEIMSVIDKQSTIKLFISYDKAKELAHGLRENAHDYTHYPKTSINRSKVRPLITIDVGPEFNLPAPKSEKFSYEECYVDQDHVTQTRSKEVELTYYEVSRARINNTWVTRAEFYNSRVKPLEFAHQEPTKSCTIS